MTHSLHSCDIAVISIYLVIAVGLGFVMRRQASRSEFFAASHSMGFFTVGLSVMATLFSANSFVMYPSAAYSDSLRVGMVLVSFSLMAPIVIWVFIPVYSRMKCRTAYEYLEQRFHVAVRCLASGLFVLLRIGWMASATFAASVAIAGISGFNQYFVILALGVVAIIYTMMGGLRAVMWTDVLQFFVFAGTIIFALILLIGHSEGGVSGITETYFAEAGDKLVTNFDFDLTIRFGTWAVLIGSFLEGLSAFGADQVAVQRYIAAKDVKTSQVGFGVNLLGMWIVLPGLLAIGTGLFSYFQANPNDLSPALVHHLDKMMAQSEAGDKEAQAKVSKVTKRFPVPPESVEPAIEQTRSDRLKKYYNDHPERVREDLLALKLQDQAMPQFVKRKFPPGVVGLLVAALMAATMSSIDSGIHSVTTALVVDFRDRLRPDLKPATDAGEMKVARILVLVIGVVSVALACFVGDLGDVFAVAKKVTAAFGGPLLAVFILALFSNRVTWQGAFIGTLIAALITGVCLQQFTDWFSLWFWPLGFFSTIAIAEAISPFVGTPPIEDEAMTYNRVMRDSGVEPSSNAD